MLPRHPDRAMGTEHSNGARQADNCFVSSETTLYPHSLLVKTFFYLRYFFLFTIIMSLFVFH